jgi:hypothetical protein
LRKFKPSGHKRKQMEPRARWKPSGAEWSHVEPHVAMWSKVETIQTKWTQLETSGAQWSRKELELSGVELSGADYS